MIALNRLVRETHALLLAHGETLSIDEAITLSGVAFRHYLFDAGINHGWRACHPGIELRPESWQVDHHGVLEALAGYLSVQLVPYSDLKYAETIALIRHEEEAGRVALMLHSDEGGALAAHLVSSIQRDGKSMHLSGCLATAGPDDEPERILSIDISDITALKEPQPGLEMILVARPTERPPTDRMQTLLRRTVLQYAVQHGANHKELSADDELFYATTSAAWRHLQKLANGEVDAPAPADAEAVDKMTKSDSPGLPLGELPAFISQHLSYVLEARAAATQVLTLWSTQLGWAEPEQNAMASAAAAWTELVERLEGLDLSGAHTPPADVLRELERADSEGFAALSMAFKPGFG